MRLNYSEDEQFPGQFALFRANVNRSLTGKAGRQALTELRDALLALPEKRLVESRFIDDGEVCAVGALVVAREASRTGLSIEDVALAIESQYSSCNPCGHSFRDHGDGPCEVCAKSVDEGKSWASPCAAFDAEGREVWDDDDGWQTDDIGASFGVPRLVAWRLVELNDIDLEGIGPEARYTYVLDWVTKKLAQSVSVSMQEHMP